MDSNEERRRAKRAILSLPPPTVNEAMVIADKVGTRDQDGFWIPSRELSFLPVEEVKAAMSERENLPAGPAVRLLCGLLPTLAARSRPVYSARDGYLRNRGGDGWTPPDANPRAAYVAIRRLSWGLNPRQFGIALGWSEAAIQTATALAASLAMTLGRGSVEWKRKTRARPRKPGEVNGLATFSDYMETFFCEQMRMIEDHINLT